MRRTMAAAAAAAGLLLCFFISASTAGDCNIRRATGDNITLELKVGVKPGQITKWLHNSKSYVEVKDNKEHCCRGSSKYLLPNGSLQLTSLTKAKGGTYEPKVYINGQLVPGLTSVNLCVLDSVPKPVVNFTCTSKKPLVLKCTVRELPKDECSYKWFHNDKEVMKQTAQTYHVKTPLGKFHCAIYNQVSEQKSDAVSSPCVETGFVFPLVVLGISVWVFVGAGGGIVLLLIMLIICCCIRNKRRRRMRIKDAEEYRLHFAQPNQQQQRQHHQNHHQPTQQQRQPPGHTGPRHHRPKGQNGAKGPAEPAVGQPLPSPRRQVQDTRPVGNNEDPPPLPQPRKKVPKGHRA